MASLLEQCRVCSAAKHRGAGQELTGLQSCWQPGTSKVAGLRKSAGRYRRQKQSLKNTVYLQLHYYLLWIMFFHESFYYRKKKKKKKDFKTPCFLSWPYPSTVFRTLCSVSFSLKSGDRMWVSHVKWRLFSIFSDSLQTRVSKSKVVSAPSAILGNVANSLATAM